MAVLLQIWVDKHAGVFETEKSEIIIGRQESCDLAITDVGTVSRRHAKIFFSCGQWCIEDLSSKHGTCVNGEMLSSGQRYQLYPGAEIELARSVVMVFIWGAPDAAEVFEIPTRTSQTPRVPVPVPHTAQTFAVQPCAAGSIEPRTYGQAKCPSVLSAIFGKKKRRDSPGDVQFRAAASDTLCPGEYFTIKVMMYREDDFARADREEKNVADRVKSSSSGVFAAAVDEVFRICLQSPDIVLENAEADLRWNGKYASQELMLLLPEDYAKKQLRLIGRVYSELAVLTDLKLVLQVNAQREQELVFEKCSLRSAFISYSSHDRAEVAARIQGILLSRPEMDLFFDAECLRRGEHWEARLFDEIARRDLFYLFWSRNAAKSEWVQKELAFALERKGPLAVEPVPLEAPEVCPPPESLRDRHFNDWTLRYSAAKLSEQPESE